ncbi:fumarylacetoacetate hydrolase family protein [Massilia sp. YIM B02443]|uniref:fumarylacetoacetate hydrolase family protein n=1 Tax=Massilia sp. YIM B02443 TaxID=3050127 RepID=UPI0025B6D800|nr:fumarylacetoacetate hydrolase family protein [Massilia sp. YIM B02443]MDN4035724.1 fumarylacetoacetate hydrolase family protein [Massilia sp. YIM B02443]
MKLATLDDGTRDGQLAVVSRDLKTAHLADAIAPTLRAALDDWAFIAPQLDALYRLLNEGRHEGQARRPFDFDPARCLAPLPRAARHVQGVTYLNHPELEARANGAELPSAWRDEPPLRERAADGFLGPLQDIVLAREEWGVDFGPGVAVLTGDIAAGATPDAAHGQIRLLLLCNDISLRNLAPGITGSGWDWLAAQPATAFAPVAVTPDELGASWRGGKADLPLRVTSNGNGVGQLEAGEDMAFGFAQLLATLCRTRAIGAGTIVGSGVVSNRAGRRRTPGYASIAEQRWLETIEGGAAVTPFMRFGDMVRIEMLDEAGKSLFGAIEQTFRRPEA